MYTKQETWYTHYYANLLASKYYAPMYTKQETWYIHYYANLQLVSIMLLRM